MTTLLDRFLRYVQINTTSNADSDLHPSTPGQMQMALLLKDELVQLGLSKINLTEQGYLTAVLEANTSKEIPTVGFIAHMDTSPDVSGQDVKPQIHKKFDGKTLVINASDNLILTSDDYPELVDYAGQTLITSDGTTLLGSDDKAGIAVIMTALDFLRNHPELDHGNIVVGFTPDEEIGHGADFFEVKEFGADFAYTVDGGPPGELEYETFNAAIANIFIQGVSVHPGSAYGRMKNALQVAIELSSRLPDQERPEFTRGQEGFYHLIKLTGSVESARITYLIRDHDRNRFEHRKSYLLESVTLLNDKYGENTIHINLEDQYYNMKDKIKPVYHIVTLAEQAMQRAGIKPIIKPVRGGTDGARLSFMGLPCPNLFAGGHNFHSRSEFISLEAMALSVEVVTNIITMLVEQSHSGQIILNVQKEK